MLSKFSTLLILVFFSFSASTAIARIGKTRDGFFSGRISRINTEAALLRIKINFTNSKYLNKKIFLLLKVQIPEVQKPNHTISY